MQLYEDLTKKKKKLQENITSIKRLLFLRTVSET